LKWCQALSVVRKFDDITDRVYPAGTVELKQTYTRSIVNYPALQSAAHDAICTSALSEAALAVDSEASKLCAGLSEEQLSWCPRPQKWSIAQNLAHLRTTTEVFLPAVDSALKSSRMLGLCSDGPFGLSPFGRFIVWRMDARPILKMRAPKILHPRLLSSAGSELEHFLASQATLRQRIAEADGLNLTAFRFPSPVARYFRVNLLEFFSACNAHARRHLWQGHNVRGAMNSAGPQNQA